MTTTTLQVKDTRAFGTIRLLLATYFGIGVAALVATFLMRDDAAEVNSTVWIRGVAVVLSAMVLAAVNSRAEQGSRSAYRRLRIIALATPIAIAVLVSLPGTLPLWARIEQGACGLLLLGVVLVANRREVRRAFARR